MSLLKIWEYHYASDFAEGVRLLVAHGGEKFLTKQSFQRLQVLAVNGQPVDEYNLGKLTGALNKIQVEGGIDIAVSPPVPPSRVDAPGLESEGVEADPEVPYKLTSPKAKALHKEQAHYHALMVAAKNEKDRGEHAGEILRISKDLDNEYDRLRSLQNPGIEEELEDVKPAQLQQSADDVRRLHSLRTRIARLKNKLIPKASGKQLADWEKELAKKQAEVQRLENAQA